ncbi:tRNA:m(4)X modification enzyme TRM13 homolog [Bombina bombina]|uniref:tRNA:m(4)X modification enzyme TRM13 homolog n=1 Tax=Bombina bombina TaxID=8345 RepID=UPI00235ACA36|nr:tRNA:m(4)X modification enzyme TRM13 homolog [Bombina bombina]
MQFASYMESVPQRIEGKLCTLPIEQRHADLPNQKAPLPGRCNYFVQRKKRFCKMVTSEGKRFCGEHAENGEGGDGRRRIPCPLDPKHTVYEDQLQKHVKKCNSREKPQPVYYVQNVNAGPQDTDTCENQVTISSLSKEELLSLTELLTHVTSGLEPPLPDKKFSHQALQGALNDPTNGESAKKHLRQQDSILGHLESLGLLGDSHCFVEFGAGRGKLSHWVDIATHQADNVHFLLVERATTRFKVDGKLRHSVFERLHIDIQHLCLERIPSLIQKQLPLVGIGKHLCGAGTDLALRCLVPDYSPDEEPSAKRNRLDPSAGGSNLEPVCAQCPPVVGIAIALCCHHRCDWQHYVGRDYFQRLGIGHREFSIFQRMSSWATCGMRTPHSERLHGKEEHGVEQREGECNQPTAGVFTVQERENLGRLCKLLIDRGRVDYLSRKGYTATLRCYTEPGVSLENVLLTAVTQ